MLISMGIVLALVVFTLWLIVYFGSALVEGWIETRAAPREPMFWCHKHGHFRAGHCVPMFNVLVCPTCYHDAIKNAEKKVI